MNMNWIAKRRGELDLSQEDLTVILQVSGFNTSRATLSHWETGRYNPPMEDPNFRRILANALQMSIPDLLIAAGFEVNTDYSRYARRAADIIDQLPSPKQKLALGLLEEILKQE